MKTQSTLYALWSRLRALFDPPSSVTDVAIRYKSRLLAAFLVVMFLLFGVLDISYYMTPGYQVTVESILGYTILVTCYILVRTGRYPLAAILTMVMFPVVLFSEVIRNESNNPIVTLNFLTLNLFLGNILFSTWGTITFALVNIIGIALMPVLAGAAISDAKMIIGPLATNVIGAALAVIAILHRDAIERERQARLQARESWFRTIYNGVNDAICIHDADTGEILDVNDKACEMYGYRHAEFLKLSIGDLSEGHAPFDQQRGVILIEETKTEGPQLFEWRARDSKGRGFWAEVNLRHVKLDGQPRVLAVVRDVSERKQAEAVREALIEELEAKNAELERFTYTVSHDLKSPLITIKGFLGFLERDALHADVERLRGDIQRIATAADKMQYLLDDLLELSRIGRVRKPPERILATELAQEAAATMFASLKGNDIQLSIAPDMPIIIGDRTRLREVWENLISNAVKFMGDQPHPSIELGAHDRGDDVVFFVRDNGIGIAPQYQDKIFDLFEKLDPTTKGTGVGLAIVKRIIETHGGQIWVESQGLGQGCTFYFTLPAEV